MSPRYHGLAFPADRSQRSLHHKDADINDSTGRHKSGQHLPLYYMYNERTSLEIFLRSSVFVCVYCEYYSDYLSPAFCTIIICMCRPHKLAITLFILDDKSQMGNSNKYTMIWHKKQQQEHHLPLQPQQHHHLYHHYHPSPLSGHANMQTWLKNGRNQTASNADKQQ